MSGADAEKATIRKFLDSQDFDWSTSRIIIQEVDNPEYGSSYPGWESPTKARIIGVDDPILDKPFDDGFGGPECPRYIAEDITAFYFPSQYDGATSPEKVFKDIHEYLLIKNPTPYPGG